MSPSQRATWGADAPSPAVRSSVARSRPAPRLLLVQRGQRRVHRRLVLAQLDPEPGGRPARRAAAASGSAARRRSVAPGRRRSPDGPQDQVDHRQGRRGEGEVVRRRLAAVLGRPCRAAANRSPISRRSGGLKVPKVRRTSGSTSMNSRVGESGDPRVHQGEQLDVVDQQQRAVGEEAVHPGRLVARRWRRTTARGAAVPDRRRSARRRTAPGPPGRRAGRHVGAVRAARPGWSNQSSRRSVAATPPRRRPVAAVGDSAARWRGAPDPSAAAAPARPRRPDR